MQAIRVTEGLISLSAELEEEQARDRGSGGALSLEGRGAGLLAAKSSRELQRSGRRPASSQSQLRSCQGGPKGAWLPSFT